MTRRPPRATRTSTLFPYPTPFRSAAQLPVVAFPGLQAGVRADRLAEMGRLLGVHQQHVVRPLRIAAPGDRAVAHVVGGDVALDAELAAVDTDEHFGTGPHGGHGAGLSRSADRRGGKGGVSTGRARWSPSC